MVTTDFDDRLDEPQDADEALEALRRRRNFFGGLAAFFFAVMVVTAVLDEVTTVHEDASFPVGPSPRIVVRDSEGGGIRGGIDVRASDQDHIRVQGKVHGTWRVRYLLEQRGDDVVVEVHPQPVLRWLSFLGPARLTISAPSGTRLDVDSQSAPISLQGIAGGGSLRTTNGAIRLDDAGGDLSAKSVNGSIVGAGLQGTMQLHTKNGGIDVTQSHGIFDVTTTNGSIVLDAELVPARHRVATINGGVTVRLRGEPSLRIDAHTTNGRVVVQRPIALGEHSSKALDGVIGAGDGELSISTVNGGITIE